MAARIEVEAHRSASSVTLTQEGSSIAIDAELEQRLLAAPSRGRDPRAGLRALRAALTRGSLRPLADRLEQAAAGDELVVTLSDPSTARWPWELLPLALDLDLAVRRWASPAGADEACDTASVVIVDALGAKDPDGARGAQAIASLYTEVESLVGPSAAQIADAIEQREASILHLIARGQVTTDPLGFALELSTTVSIDQLSKALSGCKSLRLLVLDVGRVGTHAALTLATALPQATIVGWRAPVTTVAAADLLEAFHRRLREGASTMTALRLSGSPLGPETLAHWGPSATFPRRATRPAKEPERMRGGTRSAVIRSDTKPAGLTIDFRPVTALCPALLINDGLTVEHLRIDRGEVEGDLTIELTCDTGTNVSTIRAMMASSAPSLTLDPASLNFPTIFELIGRGVHRRKLNLGLRICKGNEVLHQQTRPLRYLGPTEWLDDHDTWAYIPSYVLPESEGVKEVLRRAELGERSAFDAPPASKDEVTRVVAAIYDAIKGLGLSYVNPPAAPVYLGTNAAAGQHVRFPDDVVRHRRATCHDLALLMSACVEHYGIQPLVVMFPGHTFMGYWRTRKGHTRFWEAHAAQQDRIGRVGAGWSLTSTDQLIQLLETDEVQLVETTDAPRGRSFPQACARASGHLLKRGWAIDVAIDVWTARRSIEPLFTPRVFGDPGPSERLLQELSSRLKGD